MKSGSVERVAEESAGARAFAWIRAAATYACWSLASYVVTLAGGCTQAHQDQREALSPAPPVSLPEHTIAEIKRFCGDCHAMPLPSSFPKSSWQAEVRQGFQFYVDSMRTDLDEPIRQDVIRYFQDAAPDKIIVPRADSMPASQSAIRFVPGPAISTGNSSAATAHLVWLPTERTMLFTDMRQGTLHKWIPGPQSQDAVTIGSEGLIGSGSNFCRVRPCDFNQDAIQDYLLGDMGSFPVGDHSNGNVTLLVGQADGSTQSIVIAKGLGRVVSAEPFDYDDDGDLDVLVAEFGWRETGALRLLRNNGGPLETGFDSEIIDQRHGALGVEVGDIDGDGKLDFVVAFAQEFETVEAFLQVGPGVYDRQVLLALEDPSYNSSSFQLVDLDRDGRLDVVHTCGDTLDSFIAKPFHGLRWLRNLGGGKFENRELGLLVGALQSDVADFDGDGDLDIVGVGLFPTAHLESPGAYDSICVWEQRDGLEFVRHSIERDRCNHASCTVADVDLDGRPDLVVGEWGDGAAPISFRVFWNRTGDEGNG